ncbi:hypothetical protein D3C71_1021700 [compost metagenome]
MDHGNGGNYSLLLNLIISQNLRDINGLRESGRESGYYVPPGPPHCRRVNLKYVNPINIICFCCYTVTVSLTKRVAS